MRIRQAHRNNHFPKIIILLSALVIGAGGCAMPPPGGTVSIPGAPPRSLNITLASALKYTPYSTEALANPFVQSYIAQCERQALQHCREAIEPANSRTQFVRTQDDEVITHVILGGLEPNRAYSVGWRLLDPNGELQARNFYVVNTTQEFQPGNTLYYGFRWSPIKPATWPLGRWLVEISINGRKEAVRSFNVVEPPAKKVVRLSAFDGEWKGVMRCENCDGCIGTLEKPVTTIIERNQFDLVADRTYGGHGEIDAEGNITIGWKSREPTGDPYDWGRGIPKIFRFEGRFEAGRFKLYGQRGVRTCDITLERAT